MNFISAPALERVAAYPSTAAEKAGTAWPREYEVGRDDEIYVTGGMGETRMNRRLVRTRRGSTIIQRKEETDWPRELEFGHDNELFLTHGIGEIGKFKNPFKKVAKKLKDSVKKLHKVHMFVHKFMTPHGHIMLIRDLIKKKKAAGKKKKSSDDQATEDLTPSEEPAVTAPDSTPVDETSPVLEQTTSVQAPNTNPPPALSPVMLPGYGPEAGYPPQFPGYYPSYAPASSQPPSTWASYEDDSAPGILPPGEYPLAPGSASDEGDEDVYQNQGGSMGPAMSVDSASYREQTEFTEEPMGPETVPLDYDGSLEPDDGTLDMEGFVTVEGLGQWGRGMSGLGIDFSSFGSNVAASLQKAGASGAFGKSSSEDGESFAPIITAIGSGIAQGAQAVMQGRAALQQARQRQVSSSAGLGPPTQRVTPAKGGMPDWVVPVGLLGLAFVLFSGKGKR